MANAKSATVQKTDVIGRDSMLRAREEEGLKAMKKLQKMLSKRDLINNASGKSHALFRGFPSGVG